MSNLKTNGTFISEKVSKIRWIPEQYTEPTSFITGSWNFSPNNIRLFKLTPNDFSSDECEYIPKCSAKLSITGDVTGLEFIDADHVAVSSTDGFVSILNINRNLIAENLTERYQYRELHKFENNLPAPCNGLSAFEHNVATVGEDGRLNVLSINGTKILRSIDNADSCSMTCVSFISPKEIFTGNRMGLIKLFDIQSDQKSPMATLQISCVDEKKSNATTCIAHHPTQKHIILSGGEEGSITVWDLRNISYPASYLSAHESSITELNFHPTQPTKLFTASESGELYQWSQNAAQTLDGGVDGQLKYDETEHTNPWLSGERIKNKITWSPLIHGIKKSINSFSASGSKIISSCDNEAVYLIENI